MISRWRSGVPPAGRPLHARAGEAVVFRTCESEPCRKKRGGDEDGRRTKLTHHEQAGNQLDKGLALGLPGTVGRVEGADAEAHGAGQRGRRNRGGVRRNQLPEASAAGGPFPLRAHGAVFGLDFVNGAQATGSGPGRKAGAGSRLSLGCLLLAAERSSRGAQASPGLDDRPGLAVMVLGRGHRRTTAWMQRARCVELQVAERMKDADAGLGFEAKVFGWATSRDCLGYRPTLNKAAYVDRTRPEMMVCRQHGSRKKQCIRRHWACSSAAGSRTGRGPQGESRAPETQGRMLGKALVSSTAAETSLHPCLGAADSDPCPSLPS